MRDGPQPKAATKINSCILEMIDPCLLSSFDRLMSKAIEGIMAPKLQKGCEIRDHKEESKFRRKGGVVRWQTIMKLNNTCLG